MDSEEVVHILRLDFGETIYDEAEALSLHFLHSSPYRVFIIGGRIKTFSEEWGQFRVNQADIMRKSRNEKRLIVVAYIIVGPEFGNIVKDSDGEEADGMEDEERDVQFCGQLEDPGEVDISDDSLRMSESDKGLDGRARVEACVAEFVPVSSRDGGDVFGIGREVGEGGRERVEEGPDGEGRGGGEVVNGGLDEGGVGGSGEDGG